MPGCRRPEWPSCLVDDVTMSGGHLRACAAKLRESGLDVADVLCGGKILSDQDEHAFATVEETLDDFET
jgi:orotate phosphoribosyltransferase